MPDGLVMRGVVGWSVRGIFAGGGRMMSNWGNSTVWTGGRRVGSGGRKLLTSRGHCVH